MLSEVASLLSCNICIWNLSLLFEWVCTQKQKYYMNSGYTNIHIRCMHEFPKELIGTKFLLMQPKETKDKKKKLL